MRLRTPIDIGLPERYERWRPKQSEAVSALLNPLKRINVLSAPTGFGKQVVGVGAALESGEPTCIVTDSRGLQDQYYRTFREIGMVDIRGRSNYKCGLRDEYTCEEGYASKCPFKGTVECPSSKAEMAAAVSSLVVTNYDKWTSSRKFGTGMNHFTRVIFDEGHVAPDALARAMEVILYAKEIEETLGVDFPSYGWEHFQVWKPWASQARAIAEQKMKEAWDKIREVKEPKPSWVRHYNHMRNLNRRLAVLSTASARDWIVDELENGYKFDPVFPGKYVESALFFRIPHIGFMSATNRPKTLHLLGVSNDSFSFHEFDSDFNPQDCPIYFIPTMRVDHSVKDLSMLWARLDQIAARRRDRKGIVHTISYARRDQIMGSSRFADSMIINNQGEPPTEMIELFRYSKPGTILVSPSVGTGHDFPGSDCEWQFICKIPYPPPSKIVKAREERDKEYRPYQAMQALVQICGRGARYRGDKCENFIGDSHLEWFLPRYSHLAPKSFHGFFKRIEYLPDPPEALCKNR